MEKIVDQLLGQFEHGRISRRQLVQVLALGMAASAVPLRASAATATRGGFKAVAVNHISLEVADYARTRDFYADLLGMQVSGDDGGPDPPASRKPVANNSTPRPRMTSSWSYKSKQVNERGGRRVEPSFRCASLRTSWSRWC
jgi:hypothetical protein